jgi:Ser/Thr protein kinase RdoA (MazF antagonist)
LPPTRIAALGTAGFQSGFSGSQVYAVELPGTAGRLVLKSFPTAASCDQARFVHRLVQHLRAEGISQVPEVMSTLDNDTVVADAAGMLWELARFMPGVAVPSPTVPQTVAAATALAQLHIAASRLAGHPPREDVSPGLCRRITQAEQLLAMPWRARRMALSTVTGQRLPIGFTGELIGRFDSAVSIFADCGGEECVSWVAGLRPTRCMVQPVVRDIWCDHVLFAEACRDEVTAIIDLHAAGIDTPATDLSRLMGSWKPPDGREGLPLLDRWPEALAAYDQVRPLSPVEYSLIPLLHATAVVFGLDNWFRWTLEEQREFPETRSVLARIDRLLKELEGELARALALARQGSCKPGA